ncbi:winged helix-turn-helix domain-containing protein [Telmatobacter sp. DSM 110680]|uniref:Winged helix-turn-helix domain-containing protein n=1 Tax=Telmatobacter sp. DSM 110680 TaxID=3036704 RepID=A0AAU7DP16_9BACT
MKIDSRADHTVRFGTFELNPRTRELYRNRSKLKLHGQPIDLLEILLEHAGELVTREELRTRLWPADTFVDFEHILNNNIKRLREALDDDANAPRFIETLPRLGYRFIAPVAVIGVRFTNPVEKPEGLDIGLSPAPPPNNENGSEINIALPTSAVEKTSTKLPAHNERDIATATIPSKIMDGVKQVVSWRWAALTSVFAFIVASAILYLLRPLPLLPVAEFTQITHDGLRKDIAGTDGVRLYLNRSPDQGGFAQVATSGGELAPVPVAFPYPYNSVLDVSPDGSTLLVSSSGGPQEKWGLWSVGVPGGSRRRLADGGIDSAAWSPDGKSVVYYEYDVGIYVMRSDGSEAHRVGPVKRPVFDLAWSPDGRRIRFTQYLDDQIWEMSSDGSGLHPLLPNWRPSSQQSGGRWTPDGRFFLFLSWSDRSSRSFSIKPPLQFWALDERRWPFRHAPAEPVQLTSGPIRWLTPVLSKDGKKIFAQGTIPRGELERYDAKTRRLQPFFGGISAQDVAFSRDGKSVAYVTFPEGVLWRANQDGSNPVQLTDPPLYPILPSWSPDGAQILFDGADSKGQMQSYIVSAQGGTPQKVFPEDKEEEWDPGWSSDGRRIVFTGNGALQILDLASHRETPVPGSAEEHSPRWSPDGRFIAGISSDGDLAVFDIKAQRWSMLDKGKGVAFPAWSRDSQFIFFLRDWGDLPGVYRVRVSGADAERVVDLKGFRSTGVFTHWMGLDAEDTPLVLHEVGTSDIYALTLETK